MTPSGARVAQGPVWAGICLLLWLGACSSARPENGVAMPARFEGHRIFVDLPVRGGGTLELYTDTGGGLFLHRHAADRVQWREPASVALHEIALDRSFPEPLGSADRKLPILPPEQARDRSFDGMLGQAWFAERIWTFDYPARRLLLHSVAPTPRPGTRSAPLGFLTDEAGVRTLSFPRITVEVDGEPLELLLDTGATVNLAPEAASQLGEAGPGARATSFITTGVLTRWRQRHPDWRVVPDADRTVAGMSMIEVPLVSVAGFAVGPAWFTERPDANFHEFMSQWMDRRVDGAVGGNVLRFFRMTVDYPAAQAHFVRVEDAD